MLGLLPDASFSELIRCRRIPVIACLLTDLRHVERLKVYVTPAMGNALGVGRPRQVADTEGSKQRAQSEVERAHAGLVN